MKLDEPVSYAFDSDADPSLVHLPSVKVHGRQFAVRTLRTDQDIRSALFLRFSAFQVEMADLPERDDGIDFDEFDEGASHLGVFDNASGEMIATCRLICSAYTRKFYSEQEFHCDELLSGPCVKLEIGRVCVRKDFRNSIVMGVLWRGIAEFIKASESEILFGCGSIFTTDPKEAAILYTYFKETGKLLDEEVAQPKGKYRSVEFNEFVKNTTRKLTDREKTFSANLIPPLCRSYFEMGCRIAGPPAFDHDLKCIDFLTILDLEELSPRVRRRMFGVSLP